MKRYPELAYEYFYRLYHYARYFESLKSIIASRSYDI